jgi:hypothetical protein
MISRLNLLRHRWFILLLKLPCGSSCSLAVAGNWNLNPGDGATVTLRSDSERVQPTGKRWEPGDFFPFFSQYLRKINSVIFLNLTLFSRVARLMKES